MLSKKTEYAALRTTSTSQGGQFKKNKLNQKTKQTTTPTFITKNRINKKGNFATFPL